MHVAQPTSLAAFPCVYALLPEQLIRVEEDLLSRLDLLPSLLSLGNISGAAVSPRRHDFAVERVFGGLSHELHHVGSGGVVFYVEQAVRVVEVRRVKTQRLRHPVHRRHKPFVRQHVAWTRHLAPVMLCEQRRGVVPRWQHHPVE